MLEYDAIYMDSYEDSEGPLSLAYRHQKGQMQGEDLHRVVGERVSSRDHLSFPEVSFLMSGQTF